ncbi:TauD/TfdA family dioxygenase [Aquabacterium sp. A7-Y]|uniref:TauD/TfdA family dioxygenase n=1 Tax=Aquabacterium sp. A7-Y TaxID=1349605 RepID=UPI00223D5632|nr:TauD/TfdA family dioxygenase [Aquabacterium sp. A7-Y]MCW7539368.1 TauD/TfdA family dioxygenase [Aquabacterium sp. A7-Y]
MSDTSLSPERRPRIGAVRRQALAPSADTLVRFTPPAEGRSLPLLCEPVLPGVDLAAWAAGRREEVERLLLQHGALLWRGFAVDGVAGFHDAVGALSEGALQYQFRASPRTQVDDTRHVYTSTDYPADESIFPHNEHSYSPVFPRKIFFYCDVAPGEGGETPIGDTRTVLQRVPHDIRERFTRERILYVRNYGDGFGLPWQTVFQTDDRGTVEAYCRQQGIRVEWKSGDRLRTRQIGPAVVRHPQTGEAVWFNHGTFFHATTLPASARDALLAEFGPEDLPQNTFYGDGTPIEPEVVELLRSIYLEAMVSFPWQRGDVLMLDNILALHGRHPFRGPRRILTAMAEPMRAADLALAAAPTEQA